MRISEMLKAMASWLESPNNEAILLAEYDEDCLKIVAESCVQAAASLKLAAEQVDSVEPETPSTITPESIEELAEVAAAFDASGDENLKKQASVIDELLLSIAAPPHAYAERKDLLDQRLVELKKKYEEPTIELKKSNLIGESEKAIAKSKMTESVKIHEQPLSTRYCPDHAGQSTYRIAEHTVRCPLDGKVYSFENGYTLENGIKVPGGDVALQTPHSLNEVSHAIFDSREGRLSTNR